MAVADFYYVDSFLALNTASTEEDLSMIVLVILQREDRVAKEELR